MQEISIICNGSAGEIWSQENIVTVYKLIAKVRIEENIVKLQEKKMALADQIIGGEEMGSGSFSKEELLELLKEL